MLNRLKVCKLKYLTYHSDEENQLLLGNTKKMKQNLKMINKEAELAMVDISHKVVPLNPVTNCS